MRLTLEDLTALSVVRHAITSGEAKAARLMTRLTQDELGEYCGVASATISRWEDGHRVPEGRPALKYAKWYLAASAWCRALDALDNEPQGKQRYRLLTAGFLAEVAEVYRTNVRHGHAPTQAVAEHFHTSRQNAGKWVMQARKTGILEENSA